jgi:RND family efflux transporter MFP subunit
VLACAGCSGSDGRPAEEIRQVRVLRLAGAGAEAVLEFPGEVRARFESRLGFRIGGKIIDRKVEVGDVVRRGQVLMRLDPQDLQLARAQAYAALQSAESNRDLARTELARYQDLSQKNFVSQAVLDAKQSTFKSAQASYDQAFAAYGNQTNQLSYADLVSDVDGVVTGIDAEVGQVVTVGTAVVRVARPDQKEIAVSIPEDKVDAIRHSGNVRAFVWSDRSRELAAKVREIAPAADPATRTYTTKVSIPDAPPEVRLGMTAYVAFAAIRSEVPADAMVKLPLSALFQDKAATAVWVVENGAVKMVPVQVVAADENMLIAKGILPGQTVVTAGVHGLKAGQKVRVLAARSVADEDGAGAKDGLKEANAAGGNSGAAQ